MFFKECASNLKSVGYTRPENKCVQATHSQWITDLRVRTNLSPQLCREHRGRLERLVWGVMESLITDLNAALKKETPAGSRREFRSDELARVGALFNEVSLRQCVAAVNSDLRVRKRLS
jgi:hypothetical protein